MTTHKIALLAGDGIGPEIMAEAEKVLKLVEERNSVAFDLQPALFGACAWFETGKSFPDETIAICDNADAILKGTIGLSHEESKKIPVDEQPERGGLLPMRRRYQTYANFRPVTLPPELAHFSPLRPEIIGDGIDLVVSQCRLGDEKDILFSDGITPTIQKPIWCPFIVEMSDGGRSREAVEPMIKSVAELVVGDKARC